MPQFYKPDPKNPAVYDANGNFVSKEQYLQMTGQSGAPDDKINWGFIQNVAVPPKIDSSGVWSLPGMDAVRATLSPADQAFAQAMYQLQQGQYAAGGVGNLDPSSYAKAMQIAATDPNIKAYYGDAATTAAKDLAFSIGQITGNQATAEPALQATLQQQQKDLQDKIASAGQAYSGFRKQAENELKTQQADVIQSTRSQLQQQLQTLGRGYETQFGSTALGQQPAITTSGPITGQQSYQPVGGIIGTTTQGGIQAAQSTGQQAGYLPTVSTTGVLK